MNEPRDADLADECLRLTKRIEMLEAQLSSCACGEPIAKGFVHDARKYWPLVVYRKPTGCAGQHVAIFALSTEEGT